MNTESKKAFIYITHYQVFSVIEILTILWVSFIQINVGRGRIARKHGLDVRATNCSTIYANVRSASKSTYIWYQNA